MNWSIPKEQCPRFKYCSAPLCPLESLSGAQLWAPFDEICTAPNPPYWVKRQMKLRDRSATKDTWYSLEMIQHKCMIKKNIEGIQIGSTEKVTVSRIKKWLRSHKLKKPLSAIEREERKKRLIKARMIRHDMYIERRDA